MSVFKYLGSDVERTDLVQDEEKKGCKCLGAPMSVTSCRTVRRESLLTQSVFGGASRPDLLTQNG